MAGSYNHCVKTREDGGNGELLANEDLVGMLENGGDVYEAVEEMYGMIWWLASHSEVGLPAVALVEQARKHYLAGLAFSPGTCARLPEEDE